MKHATIIALAAIAVGVSAQTSLAADPAPTPVVYKLGEGSTYQQGCFEPCMCPIMVEVGVRGTFTLTQTDSDSTRKIFDVSDINWNVALSDSDLHITGKGQYFVGQKDVPVQRLQLQLSMNGAEAIKFDSGWQELTPNSFPHISIGVSINNWFCFDTSIVIDAKPVPKENKIAMNLLDDSTYVYGCFPPCYCPIFMGPPLTGSFSLVETVNMGTYHEYAVVDMSLKVTDTDGEVLHTWKGSGKYITIDGFAGPMTQLSLDLFVDGSDTATHFDSGLQNNNVAFPEVNSSVSVNNYVCFDTVLGIHAKPRKKALFRPIVVPPSPHDVPAVIAPSTGVHAPAPH